MFVRGLGAPITMETDEMMLPVLIPRTADPAVTGLNSNWLIALGAGVLTGMIAKPKGPKKPAPKKIKIGK